MTNAIGIIAGAWLAYKMGDISFDVSIGVTAGVVAMLFFNSIFD